MKKVMALLIASGFCVGGLTGCDMLKMKGMMDSAKPSEEKSSEEKEEKKEAKEDEKSSY